MSRSTISAADLRRLTLLVLGLLLTACGPAKVVVEGRFPSPLIAPLPMKLGIWYPPEFSGHEFYDQAKSRNESDWIVQTGAAQVAMWNSLLAGMFVETVHMKGEPDPAQMNQVVDAVLIPEVEELQYAIPMHTNIKVYEIWMRYRFNLVSSGGDALASWTMTAYGKTPTAFLQSDEAAVNLAAVMALRDAGANFATSFTTVPEVQAFLDERGIAPLEMGL